MASKSLILELIGVDTSASKTVTTFGDRATASLHKVALGALEIGAAYIGFNAVKNFLEGSIDAAAAAQTAQEKLKLAVDNVGSSFTAVSPQIDATESKLSNYGFTSADVDTALAQMTTGLDSPTKALKAISVAADLARFKNISLSSAALLVTKAMEGQIKPLRSLGIDIPVYNGNAQSVVLAQQALAAAQAKVNAILAKTPDAMNPASKAHGAYETAVAGVTKAQTELNGKEDAGQEILDTLSSRLSGSAAKAADTYAGKLDTLNAKWDDFQVGIGKDALPAISKIVDILDKKLVPALDSASKAASKGNLAGAFGAIGTKALGFGAGPKNLEAGPLNWSEWKNGFNEALQWGEVQTANFWKWEDKQSVVGMKRWEDAASHGWSQISGVFNSGWADAERITLSGQADVSKAFQHGWSQITGFFTTGWANAVKATQKGELDLVKDAGDIGTKIIKAFDGADTWLTKAGASIIDGLIAGVTGKVKDAVKAAASLAGKMLTAAKGALGIKSPSTVFRDQVGKNIVLGIAEGLTSNKGVVTRAMNGVLSVPTVGGHSNIPLGPSMGTGGYTINVYYTGVNATTTTQLAQSFHKILKDGQKAGYVPRGPLLA